MVLKKHAVLFNFEGTYLQIRKCSDNSEEVTPVPIPNTVVKLFSADDTRWETARESRTLPVSTEDRSLRRSVFFRLEARGPLRRPLRDHGFSLRSVAWGMLPEAVSVKSILLVF